MLQVEANGGQQAKPRFEMIKQSMLPSTLALFSSLSGPLLLTWPFGNLIVAEPPMAFSRNVSILCGFAGTTNPNDRLGIDGFSFASYWDGSFGVFHPGNL